MSVPVKCYWDTATPIHLPVVCGCLAAPKKVASETLWAGEGEDQGGTPACPKV